MLEKQTKVFCVRLGVSAGYQDAVNVDISGLQSLEDGVHQTLEGLGHIFKAKRHSLELKSPNGIMMTVWGATGI